MATEKETAYTLERIERQLDSYAPDGAISDPFDLEMVRKAAADLLAKGWERTEVVQYLRWMEHVDPTMDEATALRNMARIRTNVQERLAKM